MDLVYDYSVPADINALRNPVRFRMVGLEQSAANQIEATTDAYSNGESSPKLQKPNGGRLSRQNRRKNALLLLTMSLVMLVCVVAQAAYLFGRSVSAFQHPLSKNLLELSQTENADRQIAGLQLTRGFMMEVIRIVGRQHRINIDLSALAHDFNAKRIVSIANRLNYTSLRLLDVLQHASNINSNMSETMTAIASDLNEMKRSSTNRCRGTRMSLIGHRCYYLAHTNLSWSQAQEFCKGIGGGLATIYNKEVNIVLHNWTRTALASNHVFVWIGLHFDPNITNKVNCTDNSEWKWVTNYDDGDGNRNRSYWNWNEKEPNKCHQNTPENSEKCGTMWLTNRGEWNDLNCEASLRFLCEL